MFTRPPVGRLPYSVSISIADIYTNKYSVRDPLQETKSSISIGSGIDGVVAVWKAGSRADSYLYFLSV